MSRLTDSICGRHERSWMCFAGTRTRAGPSLLPSTSYSTPPVFATISYCWRKAALRVPARTRNYATRPVMTAWRRCSLRSPDALPQIKTTFAPLVATELRQASTGRALWTMLLILCPLTAYSFVQAVALYAEASSAARDSPTLAAGLSPLDGVLVPTFGALYLTVTMLFPFVAIRTLGREKETGALRLLVQLPYSTAALIIFKMTAVFTAWLIALSVPVSAVVLWAHFGGHIHGPELLNLLLGQLLYGVLVGAIALWAAAISESSATAAIIALAFTIGSWILD